MMMPSHDTIRYNPAHSSCEEKRQASRGSKGSEERPGSEERAKRTENDHEVIRVCQQNQRKASRFYQAIEGGGLFFFRRKKRNEKENVKVRSYGMRLRRFSRGVGYVFIRCA